MDTAGRKAMVPSPNERPKAEAGRVEIGIRAIAASSIRTGRCANERREEAGAVGRCYAIGRSAVRTERTVAYSNLYSAAT